MTDEELTQALADSPSPDRITPEYIDSRIAKIEFHRLTETMTVCVITLDNGFTVIGQSACADPANYNQRIGEQIAESNARANLWAPFGFLLKEAMFRRGQAK